MTRPHIDSHRSLLYTLFAIFEMMLTAGAVGLWSVDPRRMPVLADAAGITFLFSLVGVSIVSWLLWHAAPRLSRVGAVSALAGVFACSLLPAVPWTVPN